MVGGDISPPYEGDVPKVPPTGKSAEALNALSVRTGRFLRPGIPISVGREYIPADGLPQGTRRSAAEPLWPGAEACGPVMTGPYRGVSSFPAGTSLLDGPSCSGIRRFSV